MYIFELYHNTIKLFAEKMPLLVPRAEEPEVWHTTSIKHYPRFKKISLPVPQEISTSLSDSLVLRTSAKQFTQPFTLSALSSLLFFSLGEKQGEQKRMYPSAGARYPLEFYILIFKPIETLETGVYHYSVTDHTLTCIHKRSFSHTERRGLTMYDFTADAHCAIIFTATPRRTSVKYGEYSYRLMLIEAGAVAQNLFTLRCVHLT
jgi:SagB-type dehydrogenase family enzyme